MLILHALLRAFRVCVFPSKEWQAIHEQKVEGVQDVFQNSTFPLLFIAVFLLILVLGVSKQSVGMGIAAFSLLTFSHTISVGILTKVLSLKPDSPQKNHLLELLTFSAVPLWFGLMMVPFQSLLTFVFIATYGLCLWIGQSGFSLLFSEKQQLKQKFLAIMAITLLATYGLCYLLLKAFWRVLY